MRELSEASVKANLQVMPELKRPDSLVRKNWSRACLRKRVDGRRAFRRPVKVAREGCWRYRKCEC